MSFSLHWRGFCVLVCTFNTKTTWKSILTFTSCSCRTSRWARKGSGPSQLFPICMHSPEHFCGLLDPQECIWASQSCLWTACSPELPFTFWSGFCLPPTGIRALGSYIIKQLLLMEIFHRVSFKSGQMMTMSHKGIILKGPKRQTK